MNHRQKLLAYVSAMAIAAGAVSPSIASLPSDNGELKGATSLGARADALAFEQANLSGTAPRLEKFLADFPTSPYAPRALEKLIVLAAAQGTPGWTEHPGGLPRGIQGAPGLGGQLPPGIARQIY